MMSWGALMRECSGACTSIERPQNDKALKQQHRAREADPRARVLGYLEDTVLVSTADHHTLHRRAHWDEWRAVLLRRFPDLKLSVLYRIFSEVDQDQVLVPCWQYYNYCPVAWLRWRWMRSAGRESTHFCPC